MRARSTGRAAEKIEIILVETDSRVELPTVDPDASSISLPQARLFVFRHACSAQLQLTDTAPSCTRGCVAFEERPDTVINSESVSASRQEVESCVQPLRAAAAGERHTFGAERPARPRQSTQEEPQGGDAAWRSSSRREGCARTRELSRSSAASTE